LRKILGIRKVLGFRKVLGMRQIHGRRFNEETLWTADLLVDEENRAKTRGGKTSS
jgi:hypothetical protein